MLTHEQKTLLEHIQQCYDSKIAEYTMFLKKPINNPDLLYIGFLYSLSSMAVVTKEKPDRVMVVAGVSPITATKHDLYAKPLAASIRAGVNYNEFPLVENKKFTYTVFLQEVRISFCVLDNYLNNNLTLGA